MRPPSPGREGGHCVHGLVSSTVLFVQSQVLVVQAREIAAYEQIFHLGRDLQGIAARHDDIGHLAFLDGAQFVVHAENLCRIDRDGLETLLPRESEAHRAADLVGKCTGVRRPECGKGNLDPGRMELGRGGVGLVVGIVLVTRQRLRWSENDGDVLLIEKLLDLIAQVKEDKKDILSLRKVIQTLKRDEGDISARVRQLKSEKRAVQDIAKNAEQAISLITVVEEKIQLIGTQKESLDKIEEAIESIEQRFGRLEGKADELGKKESDLEISIETIAKTKDFLSNIEERTGFLKESFKEIKSIEEDIRKRVSSVDEKSQSLMGNERRIEEVLSRFKEMDALVADIEARTNQLQSTREWLARTESRLTNLAQNAERLVKELQSLTEGEGAQGVQKEGKPTTLSRESQSKVKTVLTLFEQKWTIPEICKLTKMSRGEVELILELNNR